MTTSPITALLKNKEELYNAIEHKHTWNKTTVQFILVSIIGLVLFGFMMGTYLPGWQHMVDTMWKMIVLVWGPVILCTPALYVFSSIRGSTIKISELVYLLIGALATSGIVLMALTPLTWFFMWTTDSKEFIQAMNGFFIGLSLMFGLFYFGQGMRYVYKKVKVTNPQASAAVDVLLLWFILLIVVVAQMSEKLGPWYQ
ncbi:MAG: hypothetical protein WCW27_03085 [Patescibacteria group bacterium]|jgi:hypothetical protein